VLPLAPYRSAKRRLAFGTVDAPDCDLVEFELARRFGDDRLNNRDALQTAR